jgi:hypothetical protein
MMRGLGLSRGKYKRLIKAVFPKDVNSCKLNDAEMERLTVYALINPKMLPKIGLYVERRVGKKFALLQFQHVRVAVQIIYQLIQACHLYLRLFANSVERLMELLLRQVKAPDLRVLACEMLIKFASNTQDSSLLHTLTPFLDDLMRLCLDASQSIREAALRAIVTLIHSGDSAELAEHFGKLLPGVLVNMNVTRVEDTQQEHDTDTDRRVRDVSFRVFADICRTIRPSPALLSPLFAYLDENNAWSSGGEAASFALESLQLLVQNMQPQHHYLIFIHLQTRIEARARQGSIKTLLRRYSDNSKALLRLY